MACPLRRSRSVTHALRAEDTSSDAFPVSEDPRTAGPAARIVFVAVAAVAVAIGLWEALATPSMYGLSLTAANEVIDARPWGWTLGWLLFAVIVLVLALWRASRLRRPWGAAGSTTVRGAVWLWGAIAGSWTVVWAAWDMQMSDVLGLEGRLQGFPIAVAFAFSGVIALVIAPLWSLITRLSRYRTRSVRA